ncbi:MAG: DUF4199 domain-containing protein [Rhodothermales bacterium]|nr:DUF4199 domain-containing protein [Rhodothermales bacterium]
MKKTSLKYGGIGGLILGTLFAIAFAFLSTDNPNYKLSEVIGYVTMILSLSVVYFGIRNFRDDDLDGSISFGKAFTTGLAISAVAALIFAAFDTLYVTVLNPEFFADYMDWQLETMTTDGASQVEIQKVTDQFEMFLGPMGAAINGVVMFLTVFLIGLVVSLISSVILKKTD